MTGTDIAVTPPTSALPTRGEWNGLREVADTLGRSGIFKGVGSVEQAIAKVMFGRDLGLGATQALTGIHLVEGKPELSANLQAALLRQYRSPEGARYDYRASVSTDGASITVFRIAADATSEEIGTAAFTMADAERAGLSNKPVWKSYPANMCFARALSNAVAFFCPEVAYGTRVYAEGELEGTESWNEPPSVEAAAPIRTPGAVALDDRPARLELESALKGRGLTRGQAKELVAAALTDLSVPENDDFDKRLRLCDDDTLRLAAANLTASVEPIVDAEVVPEADPQAEEFAAQMQALDGELGLDAAPSTTTNAIQGDE